MPAWAKPIDYACRGLTCVRLMSPLFAHMIQGGHMNARTSLTIRTLIVLVLLVFGFGGSLAPFGLAGSAPRVARAAATLTVTTSNDSGPGSLRQAIANAAAGGTITLTPP